MKRFKLPIAIGLAAVLAIASIGAAFAAWCWSDPVIGIQAPGKPERDLRVDVAVPDEYRNQIFGDIDIRVTRPMNASARVKMMDNVLPERVSFFISSPLATGATAMPVDVVVRVNGWSNFPVQAKITYTASDGTQRVVVVAGNSNQDLQHVAQMKP